MSNPELQPPTRPWPSVRGGDEPFAARGESPHAALRWIALVTGAWTAYALLRAALWWAVSERYSPIDDPRLFIHGLGRGWIWAAMTPCVLLLCRRFPWTWRRAPQLLLVHGAAATVCTLVESAAFRAIWVMLAPHAVLRPFTLRWLLDVPANTFLYLVVATLATTWQQRAVLDLGRRRALLLRARSAHARLHTLTAQLQPHFLGNALNAVAELVHHDVPRARRTLAQLRALLLGPLAAPAVDLVPLADELALLDAYLAIQRTRFGDRLALGARAAPDVAACLVPRFLVQPLVENSILHGAPGRVEVEARREGDRLRIRVRDDGAGLSLPPREGVGLRNSRLRLEELGGALTLGAAPGGGTEVVADLPLDVMPPPAPADVAAPPASPRARRAVLAALVLGGFVAMALMLAVTRVLLNPYTEEQITFAQELPSSLVFVALFAAVALPLVLVVRAWPDRFVLHLGLVTVAAVVLPVVRGLIFAAGAPPALDESGALNLQVDLSVCTAAIAAAHALVYLDRARERALEAAGLETELAEAALRAGRARLDPPALAAALDEIDRTAAADVERADELTVELARSLRQQAVA